MANPIPPLLSSTPPPIDFDEESSTNNDVNDDFCEFDTGETETFDGQSLPCTPRHLIQAINKELSWSRDENTIIDTMENEEKVNDEEITMSREIEPSLEINGELIERDESETISEYLNDFEVNSKSEKKSNNKTDLEDCVLENDDIYASENIGTEEVLSSCKPVCIEVNNKNDKVISDDNKENLFETDVKEDILINNISLVPSHIEIEVNEECASKIEIIESITENINDINESQDDISNYKNTNLENSSICESENNCTSKHDGNYVPDIQSEFSEPLNTYKEECNFTFEADFSQFQTFDSFETANTNQIDETSKFNNSSAIKNLAEIKVEYSKDSFSDEDDFENFQNYTNQIVNDPDTDDSNEFTDFKEAAPPPLSEISSSNNFSTYSNLKEKIKIILNTMFPINESDNNTNKDLNIQNDYKTTLIINSVDSATALNFQWSNSTIKHSLVKSIGIDSRNILHGEKWNSSMPRFAANLGFNPLEPIKPIKLDSTIKNSNYLESEPSTSLGKSVANRIDVPAVEFDWNTSGLVNPLDGGKDVIHERKTEILHTTKSDKFQDTSQKLSKTENTIDDLNCSGSSNPIDTKSIVKIHEDKEPINTKEYSSTFDTNLNIEQSTGPTIIKPNNLENMKNLEQLKYTNYQSSENIDVTSSSSSANTFIVPLKETHIFTPSKSDAAVSRSTTNIAETPSNGKCATIDFDYEIAAAGTVIDETVIKKEYRDIEYNPNKFIINTLNINPVQMNETQNTLNTDKSEISEGPIRIELSTANGAWDFCNNTLQTETNYVLDDTLQKKIDTNLRKELSIDTDESLSKIQDGPSIERFNIFLKPTIGLSPTENLIKPVEFQIDNKEIDDHKMKKDNSIDDEFTDFQFVPPSSTSIPSRRNSPQSISSHKIINKDKEKSQRINTLDHMILSPAILLPQSVQINCEPKIDWPEPGIDPDELARIETLFPSVKQNNFHNQSSNSLSHTSHISKENICTSTVNNDDDWSDFISVPAVNENNLNTIYCPKSPTKVAKSMTTTTNEHSNDDEWSDFISSTPSTNTINSEELKKPDNVLLKNNYLHNFKNHGTDTSQQNYKNIPNQLDQNMINNKICQYLLNNGNVESNNTMHLNSIKTTDYAPQNLYQQQPINQQQNITRNPLNHHKVAPNISLIPDLGYAAPQNFISIPKTNFQKK